MIQQQFQDFKDNQRGFDFYLGETLEQFNKRQQAENKVISLRQVNKPVIDTIIALEEIEYLKKNKIYP